VKEALLVAKQVLSPVKERNICEAAVFIYKALQAASS
jgi:hypothetical protein